MRKLLKRVSAVVCAAALTVAMTSTCFAADRWVSYFGQNQGWYEGAIGEMKGQTEDSWTADLQLIGWGGVWGAQVKDESLSLKAGTEYKLEFNIESSIVDKWVFIKVANESDDLLFGDWVQVKTGKKTAYSKTFTLDSDATKIVFGIGGEFGDRTDEADMYALTSTLPNDGDANYATVLTCTDFVLEEAAAEKEDTKKDDKKEEASDEKEEADVETETEKSTAVQTGDSTPIACAAVAIVAAAAIVVFTRKREDA